MMLWSSGNRVGLVAVAVASLACVGGAVHAQTANKKMSFFVTSAGSGKGADLGGIAGADAICASLAKAAGSAKTSWHAYLSVSPTKEGDKFIPGVNARDRIGKGPWYNAKGEMIASNVASLHSGRANVTEKTALTEKGEIVPGRVDVAGGKPNQHDMLTGSDPEGMYSTAGGDTTCGNWTKSTDAGSAILGHHDRLGLNDQRHMKSWNSAHGSAGCSQPALIKTGGNGLFYCFAAN